MNARILIADDHEVLREGLKSLLAKSRPEWEICEEAQFGCGLELRNRIELFVFQPSA